jgi:hypothetical protein
MPNTALTQANPPASIGYLSAKPGEVIAKMAQNRVWVWGMTPDLKIFVQKSYPVHIMATTPESVIAACHAVLLGSGIKDFGQGPIIAAGSVVQNLSIALAQRAFGMRVTVYADALNYRPGWYHFALSDGAYSSTAGANLGEVYVKSPYNTFEIMMFSIQSAGGQATIVGMAVPTVTVVASDSATVADTATTTKVGVAVETLNERDLQH